jgi:hypothetical protein
VCDLAPSLTMSDTSRELLLTTAHDKLIELRRFL